MLSASNNCRWLSFGATPASIVWAPKLATPAPSVPTVYSCFDRNKKPLARGLAAAVVFV
jgi:hypothetical protein